ncbi:MAG: hypothetical protein Q7S47_01735 [bacterium]|nr:hypothetical protein [bacterium]
MINGIDNSIYYIKKEFPDAIHFDLLNAGTYNTFFARPTRLSQMIPPQWKGWVILDVDLFAGRALTSHLYPLTASELEADFTIEHALKFGTLPSTFQA